MSEPAPLDAESAAYQRYHEHRYAVILARAAEALRGVERARVLDVGPMIQTRLLRERFPSATIDSLGFEHPTAPPRAHERHIGADLDHLAAEPPPAGLPRPDASYDLVVMAEVIEHLHAPGTAVLAYVGGFLRPGGVLLVQTPNVGALHKRVRSLLGRGPLNAAAPDPGHVHEYSPGELAAAARAAGLEVVEVALANYFAHPSLAGRAYRAAGPCLPRSVRHGITLVAHRT